MHPTCETVPARSTTRWSVALVLGAALALGAASAAGADPTDACHCYQDRTFDPERPAAADPYILATTRSSLLSAAFGVDKRSLVGAVMSGTAAEDLWVANFAAAAGRPAEALLALREERGSWKAALAGASGLDPAFAAALAGGADTRALAGLAVDGVLAGRLRATPASLKALREAGASPEERILVTVLAGRLKAPPVPLVAQVRAGKVTWGKVLGEAGLTPKELDGLVRSLVAQGSGKP